MGLDLGALRAEAAEVVAQSEKRSHSRERVWLGPGWRERRGLASYLDATLLRPESTRGEVLALCDRAKALGVAAVCLNPAWVGTAATRLAGAPVIAAVVDFPLGAGSGLGRRTEARLAMLAGAGELDVVAPLGLIKAGMWQELSDDLEAVIATGRPARVKIILETAALTPHEAVLAALVARRAGADWVKTSTGFHSAGGATPETVHLLRLVAGERMGVKASGGIRSLADAARMLSAGADRIGASTLEALVADQPLGELLG